MPGMAQLNLNKYSNSGKISSVHLYLKTKEKVSLWLFPNCSYFTICPQNWEISIMFALFHTILNEVRKSLLMPQIHFKLLTSCFKSLTKLLREALISLKSTESLPKQFNMWHSSSHSFPLMFGKGLSTLCKDLLKLFFLFQDQDSKMCMHEEKKF